MAYIEGNYSQYIGDMKTFDSFDPLLVNLHDSLRNYRVDKNDTNHHSDLIQSVLALLDAKLSEREKNLAADVLIGLIKQAEQEMRHSLAAKLAPREDLPTALLHYIAYEDIGLAEPVLLQSPQLSDNDLLYIIHAKEAAHWQAIARRERLSDAVIIELANQNDELTSINLLDNKSVYLMDDILRKISQLAMVSPNVAEKFVHYDGLPRELAVEIYWHVSTSLRAEITSNFDVDASEIDKALEDCIQDFTDTVLQSERVKPSNLMVEVASYYSAENLISGALLAKTLRRRQGRFFIALFAKLTNLKHQIIVEMMQQIGGQGIAVAARAKNISKDNFVSIFLLCRTLIRSKQPVSAQELNMAIRYYDSLTIKMANEILEDSLSK